MCSSCVSNVSLPGRAGWTTTESGAQVAVILGEIELTDAAPCIRGEGQQRVDGQTLEITNWPLAEVDLYTQATLRDSVS